MRANVDLLSESDSGFFKIKKYDKNHTVFKNYQNLDSKYLHQSEVGDGRIAVERSYTDENGWYGTIQVDEMIFFNRTLTSADIQTIINSV